jgi:hypothetical protein
MDGLTYLDCNGVTAVKKSNYKWKSVGSFAKQYGDRKEAVDQRKIIVFRKKILDDSDDFSRSIAFGNDTESENDEQYFLRMEKAEEQLNKWFKVQVPCGSHPLTLEETGTMLELVQPELHENWFELGCGEPRVAFRISSFLEAQVLATDCMEEVFDGIYDRFEAINPLTTMGKRKRVNMFIYLILYANV